jgi:hypothetical protein
LARAALSRFMNGDHAMREFLGLATLAMGLIASSAAFAGEKTVTLAEHVLRGLSSYCARKP